MAAGQIRGREVGVGPEVAAGDRCRGCGTGQGFPLQNLFKQANREPDPKRESKLQGYQRGPWLEGWEKREGDSRVWREGWEDEGKGQRSWRTPKLLPQAQSGLACSSSIPSHRIAPLEVILVLGVPLAPAPLAPIALSWPRLANRDSSRA